MAWICCKYRFYTLLRPMELSIKLSTVKPGLSIVFYEGLQVIISKKKISWKIVFILANIA